MRANIMRNDEKLKAFPLRTAARQGCLLSLHLFNTVLIVLATAKWNIICKGRKTVTADDMIICRENPKDFSKLLP